MTTHRILITGSRWWPSPEIIEEAITQYLSENGTQHSYVVVHGDAMGADTMAAYAGEVLAERGWDVSVEAHPADWSDGGKTAGFVRNQKMVKLGADVMLSFNYNNSGGTRHCTNLAHEAEIPIRLYTA